MSCPAIQFQSVSKSYGSQTVLEKLELTVEKGEFLTIIGRSGCGKTTALKLINGLIRPDEGRILVEGEDVASADQIALRRRIGYAIQGVGLFPHMTVERNIAYVPSLSGQWDKATRKQQVAQRLTQVGLDPTLAGRYPRELSGGQRQRVGIARAMASDPDILLMDEPFGAVDEITREQLQDELLDLHRQRGLTIVFVTHDIAEAVKLGTRLMVMDQGKVLQCAPPQEVIQSPASEFVSRLVNGRREFQFRQDA